MDHSTLPISRTWNIDLQVWLMWVIASTAAILISVGILIGLIFIANAISTNVNEDRLAGAIMLPITATILGVCQWLVLRSRISKSGWWILATILGTTLAVGVVQIISRIPRLEWNWDSQLGFQTMFVFIGFMMALAQLPILWEHFKGSVLWILFSIIGWLVMGLIVGISIDRTSDIIAVGVIPAIFTGFGLIWLMRKPRIELKHSPESSNITS